MRTSSLVKLSAAAALLAGASLPAQALTINLIDIGGVTGSKAEIGFAMAAAYWESVLTNDAVVNFEVGFSDLGPNVLGGTRSTLFTYVPIDFYYGLLAGSASSSLDAQALANLRPLSPTGSVTVTVPEYFNPALNSGVATSGSRIAPDGLEISNTIALSSANVKAVFGGFETLVDADIQFSSTFAFDFDPTDGIAPGTYDFIGVAVHEMGHALGFLSGAQDFDYSTGINFAVDDYWWGYGADMFRYSAPGKLDWTFNTDSYFSLDGGVTPYLDGYFSTGAINGDGWQASHWKEPTVPCTNFRGIMNPYICNGLEDATTALDLALLDAIGWNTTVDVAATPGYMTTTGEMYDSFFFVPEPSTWAMMILGFGFVGSALRRQRGLAAA